MRCCRFIGLWTAIFALATLPAKLAPAQVPTTLGVHDHPPYRLIYPQQRQPAYRDPSQFPVVPLPPASPPPTVTNPPTGQQRYFGLDDAIRTSLGNARVVRI